MKRCFQYTEIRTKITSLFPFAMSLALLFYRRQTIRWGATAVFFASMFLFDLTTTAINNYIDSKSTQQQLAYRRRTALIVIWALFFISAALGLYLVVLTDIVVLLTGALCFACGVFYTYGPVPISRQPLGEILSGVFYGFFIPFLILYINMPAGALLRIQVDGQTLTAAVQIRAMLELLLLSSIPTFTTANIMLANNICDLQRDIKTDRFTLPYYLGKKSLTLFAVLYYLCYLAMLALVAFGMLPALCLLSLLTLPLVQRNIRKFFQEQRKETTFGTSIHNYILINGSVVVVILLSALLS